jgi:large subunit ribosomal protein L4
MAVVEVQNLEGKSVGQVELADAVFAASVNPYLLHEAVRWYLAGQRAGTHKTKGRGEVSGAGRKLWRQKGTGRARVGSIRSSIWRKGGTVHGPQPRDYSYRLPKKMFIGALRSALSAKLADSRMTVVDGLALQSHKTKQFRQALSRLDGKTRTILVIEAPGNHNLELASRNLEGVHLVAPTALQPYDLLRHDRLILSKDTALHLGRTLGNGSVEGEKESEALATPAAAPAAKEAKAKPAAAKAAAKPRAAAKTAKPKAEPKAAAKAKPKGKSKDKD